jgi:hypothetical protein
MKKKVMTIFAVSLFFVTGITYADVYINTASGNSLLFSKKKLVMELLMMRGINFILCLEVIR